MVEIPSLAPGWRDKYGRSMIDDVINTFYEGLAARDGDAMVSCYHDKVVFEDPAFGELQAEDACAMWQMLCASGTDLSLTHKILESGENTATVNWVAKYTFSTTGRKVTNDVTATLKFDGDKIIDHRDSFSFYKWSSQALGLPGQLLGWTPIIKSKVRATTRKNLDAFSATST